ncbi:SMC5-SMC6 complex localization factor protein 2 isoform 2-T2 [Rhinophrynus dorsalis]
MQRLLEGSEGLESSITSNNATKNAFDTQSLFLETSVASSDSSNISSSSESSSDLSFSSNGKRKKRRKKILSSDEEEEMLQPLDEIMNMASKPLPATPDKPFLELATFSSPQTPAQKNTFIAPRPAAYINSLARLVKEKEESERVNEMERQLQEDLERGMGKFFSDAEESFEEGQLADEHKEFLKKYSVVMNDIPDQPPGEEIFQLPASGMIFNHRTLNLRHSGFSSPNPEENLIFSCDAANQLMLASEGFLVFLYRFKRCPAILTKWMFQMVSVHPSYIVSVKILNTLIEIICNSFSNAELKESPWIPSLLDVATVFSNMGVSFQTLFPLQHLQPTFGYNDLVSAVPVSVGQIENPNGYIQAFTSVPKMQITNVIKFLGFCTAVCTENFSDWEIRLLLVLLLKMHLEKLLQYAPVVDLHCLVTNLLENIRDWETEMPVLAMALSELSSHHHNFVKLVELVPASHTRGRQVRRQMCLIFISKLVEENFSSIPLDYDSQMSFLCQCMVQMKPSALLKKMQRNLENNPSIHLELDREAYYLTFNLLNLVNVASTSEENPSIQRKYLLRLCTALEKHIKCDIREDPRIFYRTKGKLHDYWEPLRENQSPSSSQEECTNCVSA